MIFNSKEEALQSRIKFIQMDKSDDNYDEFVKHFRENDFFTVCKKYDHRKVGKFFLYEKEESDKIYYPKLGIYLNELPCDQTTEVEWIDYRRTWEWNAKYKYTLEIFN